jgi:hypothetical protein
MLYDAGAAIATASDATPMETTAEVANASFKTGSRKSDCQLRIVGSN